MALAALARLRAGNQARVPAVWWFEVRNAFLAAERRGRVTEGDVGELLHGLRRLAISIDRSPDEASLLHLARRHSLTVYDASYLELAQREGLPLATLDKELCKAAPLVGVRLFGA